MQLANQLLAIKRLPKYLKAHYEIKDPSVVQISEHHFMMYASIGNSKFQQWLVGRFETNNIDGPWSELEAVDFSNLQGPQLCAPAVTYETQDDGSGLWTMYIQTACFEEDGVIALATSSDGHHFTGQPQPIATKESIQDHIAPIVGVYDVGVSEVKLPDRELLCMMYSGYRRVGCGDIFVSYKNKADQHSEWSVAQCVMSQESVPFHNHPDYEHFEWGLEGAKLVQLADDCFLIIGVCFLPKPSQYLGTRQRVFFAVADSINGPFHPVGLPFVPQDNEWKTGENGHPDTIIVDGKLHVIYQERFGDGHPWHLRSAEFDLIKLEKALKTLLHQRAASELVVDSTEIEQSSDFDYHNYHLQYV